MKRWTHGVAALVVVALTASPASAATVLAPAQGARVSSRPVFSFDFTDGEVDFEASRSPDVQTGGGEEGKFVDPDDSHDLSDGDFTLKPSDTTPGSYVASSFNAGRWYWHVSMRDDSVDGFGDRTPWTEVRTMTVRDEPAELNGYTLTARRLRTIGTCAVVELKGKVAWDDNDDRPSVYLILNVRVAGHLIVQARTGLDYDGAYDTGICTRRSSVTITPVLHDRAGHVTAGARRVVKIRS